MLRLSFLLRPTLIFAALLLGAGLALRGLPSMAESARAIPPPALDEPANPQATSEVAVLAGGCFWGVQGVFQHVEGVIGAVSGYAGGAADTAHYETVSTGTTGHAESVRITFDPRRISYGHILQIYFSVAHDPTEFDRQGPDIGTQYRSAIFPTNPEQARIAETWYCRRRSARCEPPAHLPCARRYGQTRSLPRSSSWWRSTVRPSRCAGSTVLTARR